MPGIACRGVWAQPAWYPHPGVVPVRDPGGGARQPDWGGGAVSGASAMVVTSPGWRWTTWPGTLIGGTSGGDSGRFTSVRTVAARPATRVCGGHCRARAGCMRQGGPECGAGGESRAAAGVMDGGHLEWRPAGDHRPGGVAGERDVVNDRVDIPAAGVVDHGASLTSRAAGSCRSIGVLLHRASYLWRLLPASRIMVRIRRQPGAAPRNESGGQMRQQARDPRGFFQVIRRHGVLVGIAAAAGLLAGAVFAAFSPVMITSTASVLLPPLPGPVLAATVVIARSDPVLAGALPRVSPAVSLETLRGEVQVKSVTRYVLSVSASARTAGQAEAAANAVAGSYIGYASSAGSPAGRVQAQLLAPAMSATGTRPLVQVLLGALLGLVSGVLTGVTTALVSRRPAHDPLSASGESGG